MIITYILKAKQAKLSESERRMHTLFAVGHMAIAYLLGKGSSKPLRVKFNIPILLVLSILPDVDIVFDYLTNSQIHRGPTHSIVVATLAFIPFFIIYRKRAIPYFLALIAHPLIGDFSLVAYCNYFGLFQQTSMDFTN
jgi:membrane-bound metal-dependent hydrolase YbcI (DUF457 family)